MRSSLIGSCSRLLIFASIAIVTWSRAAEAPSQEAEPAPAPASSSVPSANLEELLEAGRQLWEQYAPAEWKERYAFPTLAEAESFLAQLERDLAEGSFESLAGYEPDARRLLPLLRQFEGGDTLADWLEPRLDLLRAAAELLEVSPPPEERPVRAPPTRPGTEPRPETDVRLPSTESRAQDRAPLERPYWQNVIVGRAPPAPAQELVPRLKEVFREEGVPPEWVWIAEVESSMNPRARSPAGAQGLFQFMPATAQRFGLSIERPDERNDPEKSARAAAAYLRFLHRRFDSWPLALAAYNAGEGRVGRAVSSAQGARTFAAVAEHLPAQTRLYVPKVLATVATRESVDPESLPAPRAR